MRPIDPRNIEVPEPEIIESLRRMSGRETLQQALAAHELGRRLVESGVRGDHPEWSDQEVQIEIIRRMHGDAIAALAGRYSTLKQPHLPSEDWVPLPDECP